MRKDHKHVNIVDDISEHYRLNATTIKGTRYDELVSKYLKLAWSDIYYTLYW